MPQCPVVRPGRRGGGIGMKVFAKQVDELIAAGFDEIRTEAAGHAGHETYIGYKMWPKFGYDGELEEHHKKAFQRPALSTLPPKPFRNCSRCRAAKKHGINMDRIST